LPQWKQGEPIDPKDKPDGPYGAQFHVQPNCGGQQGCPSFPVCRLDCLSKALELAACCKMKKAVDDAGSGGRVNTKSFCGGSGIDCPPGSFTPPDCKKMAQEIQGGTLGCPLGDNVCDWANKINGGGGVWQTTQYIYKCLCPQVPAKCGIALCGIYGDINDGRPCLGKNSPNDTVPGVPPSSPPFTPGQGGGKHGKDWEIGPDGPQCKGGNKNGVGGGKGGAGGGVGHGKCCGNPGSSSVPGPPPPGGANGGYCVTGGGCGPFCQGDSVCTVMKDPCLEQWVKDWDETDSSGGHDPGGGTQGGTGGNGGPIWHVTGCPACAPGGIMPGPGGKTIQTATCNGEWGHGGGTGGGGPVPFTAPNQPVDVQIQYVKIYNNDKTEFECIPIVLDETTEYELCSET
jgi:hypothetical protein